MSDNIRIASYRALRKEKKAMKLPRSSLVWCVLIVCLTLLIFTYLTRKSLCEIRYRDGYREVAAFRLTNPVSSNSEAGVCPPF